MDVWQAQQFQEWVPGGHVGVVQALHDDSDRRFPDVVKLVGCTFSKMRMVVTRWASLSAVSVECGSSNRLRSPRPPVSDSQARPSRKPVAVCSNFFLAFWSFAIVT